MHKSLSEYRDGYKAHIAIEPETGLVTATALTPANAPDGATGVTLLGRRRHPVSKSWATVPMDQARPSPHLARPTIHAAIKPWPLGPGRSRRLHRDDFVVDDEAGTATCPAGHTVTIIPEPSGCVLESCARSVRSENAAQQSKRWSHTPPPSSR